MRLMPPLVIEASEVDYLLEALDAAMNDLASGAGSDEDVTPARPRRRPQRAAGATAG
jgi:hypothetical protein